MITTCLLEKLNSSVSKIEKLATKQAGLPILGGVFILVTENSITLRATNLHVGAEITVPAQTEEIGSVVVDAQVLQKTLSSLGREKKVTLTLQDGNLVLQTEKTNLLIKTFPPDDFPTLPKDTHGMNFVLPVTDFLRGVEAVFYSASRSDIKPEISSVYMYQDKGQLVFVATDSFRLAEKKVTVKNLPEFEGILIPVKNITEILRLLSQEEGNMEIIIGENQISCTTPSIFCTSRLVDGSFPDYGQIIPKEKETIVTMVLDDVKQGLRVISVFSDKYNQVDIEIVAGQKECVVRSSHSDVGSSTIKIPAKIEGPSIDSRLNYTYITDAFQSIEKDSIQFAYNGNNKPVVLTGVHDTTFLYLIMPMNR
jgi:DNA polymerase-3 subunit beta